MNYRPQRLGQVIRDQLSLLIARELEFDGALATVTEVVVDGKIEVAKALVSVWPSEKQEAVLQVLNQERGRLKNLLVKKLLIKYPPDLLFVSDTGPADAARVERAFMQVEQDEKGAEG